MGSPRPVIFISYSHKDRQWLDFVQGHLQVGVANDHFETWDDRRIAGGADWEKEIDIAGRRAAGAGGEGARRWSVSRGGGERGAAGED
jgi:hypothetical protein